MFDSEKRKAKKDARIAYKQKKKAIKAEAKQKKLQFKVSSKAKQKPAKVQKHITKLAIVGSRLMTAGVAVLGAATFHEYLVFGIYNHTVWLFSAAVVGASLLAAAPYIKSIARANATLNDIDNAMVAADKIIGENKQLMESAIMSFEKAQLQSGAKDIKDIKTSLEQLHQKVGKLDANSKNPSVEVHTGEVHSNNVIAK